MRYYKTLKNAMKAMKKGEAVVFFNGFDEHDDKAYRVMPWEMFRNEYSFNGLYHLLSVGF